MDAFLNAASAYAGNGPIRTTSYRHHCTPTESTHARHGIGKRALGMWVLNVRSQVSQAVPTWNPQTISTPNAEMRPMQGFFRGHRCTGFWRTLVFQSAHPSGSQRKSRTRGKGSHRRHFLTTQGHYYDNGQTLWSLRRWQRIGQIGCWCQWYCTVDDQALRSDILLRLSWKLMKYNFDLVSPLRFGCIPRWLGVQILRAF